MKQEYLDLYRKVFLAHQELFGALIQLENKFPTETIECAEHAYALKKSHELIDSLRKKLAAQQGKLEKVCGVLWAKTSITGDPIRSKYVTATPKLKQIANIPGKNSPEAYTALMNWFGVNEEFIESHVLRPHWPTFCDLLTERAEQGLPLPKGIDPSRVYPEYSLGYRKGKEPLLTEE